MRPSRIRTFSRFEIEFANRNSRRLGARRRICDGEPFSNSSKSVRDSKRRIQWGVPSNVLSRTSWTVLAVRVLNSIINSIRDLRKHQRTQVRGFLELDANEIVEFWSAANPIAVRPRRLELFELDELRVLLRISERECCSLLSPKELLRRTCVGLQNLSELFFVILELVCLALEVVINHDLEPLRTFRTAASNIS